MRHPYGVPVSAPAPGRTRRLTRRSNAPHGAGLHLTIVRPSPVELDAHPQVRDNPAMDPVVIALAQLVRDRWTNEQRARADHRRRFRVVPGEPA